MRLTNTELQRLAADTGFAVEPLTKVIRLMEMIEAIRSHPFLKSRVALKGGTALNLFVFDVPRLSVDIDFNYIGATDRETMLADRPKVEQAVRAVCGRLGLEIKRAPSDHAGGKYRLAYVSSSTRSGTLELDVNFMLRTPLWPPTISDSKSIGPCRATRVPVVEQHELAAGKIAALLARNASRDLFDTREILKCERFDPVKLRLAFVVYGGISRKDWRGVSVEEVTAEPARVERQLLPILRRGVSPGRDRLVQWVEQLVIECRDLLSAVLPLNADEIEFFRRLNERGEIVPELLTSDDRLKAIISSHPGLRWKALNVRKYHST